jgi:hypothetical protein
MHLLTCSFHGDAWARGEEAGWPGGVGTGLQPLEPWKGSDFIYRYTSVRWIEGGVLSYRGTEGLLYPILTSLVSRQCY